MAIQTLCSGSYGGVCSWSADWDNVAFTIGATVSGQASQFFFEVSDGTFGDQVVDCLNGPAGTKVNGVWMAGNILGAGRVIMVGPGSVLGVTTQVKTLDWHTDQLLIGTRWTP